MPLYQVDIPETTVVSMMVWADDAETAERVGLYRWLQGGTEAVGFWQESFEDREEPTAHEVSPEGFPTNDVREFVATLAEIKASEDIRP